MQRSAVEELQLQLGAAEEALAAKQEQIDSMTVELQHKEKQLETISVFQAQVSVTPRGWGASCPGRWVTPGPLSAGRGVLVRLLRGARGQGEAPRGEGASGHSAGVHQEAEHAAAGGDGLTGPVINGSGLDPVGSPSHGFCIEVSTSDPFPHPSLVAPC